MTGLKTLTYGVMHLTVAITVGLVLTGDWRLALAIGLVEPLVQTGAFAVHERAWKRVEARRAERRRQAVVSTEPPAAAPSAA